MEREAYSGCQTIVVGINSFVCQPKVHKRTY